MKLLLVDDEELTRNGLLNHIDWNSLGKADCGDKKLFLAGGLTPDNVRSAIEAVKPDVVDISSGVEYDNASVKGKDGNKVKIFIQNAKY